MPGMHSLLTCYIRPSQQVKMYKKLMLNDEDFMNESIRH